MSLHLQSLPPGGTMEADANEAGLPKVDIVLRHRGASIVSTARIGDGLYRLTIRKDES
ncbi:hypothetical protein [Desulfobaculum senezii]|jgi:hypothetical protein